MLSATNVNDFARSFCTRTHGTALASLAPLRLGFLLFMESKQMILKWGEWGINPSNTKKNLLIP